MIWIVRLFVILGIIFSVNQAQGSLASYHGQRAFQEKDYAKATRYFEKSYRQNQMNPSTMYFLGRSLLDNGLTNKDQAQVRKAGPLLQKFVQEMPTYGKGWIHLSRAIYHASALSGRSLSRKEMGQIKTFLRKGVELEPTSAWTLYTAGIYFLQLDRNLSTIDKNQAIKWLRQSSELHIYREKNEYLDSGAKHLESILEFLWSKYRSFSFLKAVTPSGRMSYSILLDVIKRNGLWKHYNSIWNDYRQFQEEEYREALLRAQQAVGLRSWADAFIYYRKAFWADKSGYEALAGTYLLDEKHEIDYGFSRQKVLQQILEEERLIWEPWMLKRLNLYGEFAQSPYLRGLVHLRQGDFGKADSLFQSSEHKRSGYYADRALLAMGKKQEMLKGIGSLLGKKNPDIKHLKLYLGVGGEALGKKITEKIESSATTMIAGDRWWADGKHVSRVARDKKIGVSLNLLPDSQGLRVRARLNPAVKGEFGVASVTLYDGYGKQLLGYLIAGSAEWSDGIFPLKNVLGKRWLEIKLMTESKAKEMEMGDIEVIRL